MVAATTQLPDQGDRPDGRDHIKERSLDHEEGLYRHSKKPEWGVAILAWERGGKRAYQFEDGRLRLFKKGYYSLMRPAKDFRGSEEALVNDLQDAVDAKRGAERPKPLEPVCSFEEQIQIFEKLYPKGFEDPKWISEHRRDPAGRALKRHREPVVERARTELSKERCDALLAEEKYDELVNTVTDILGSTSLIALKDVKVLRALEGDDRETFAKAVRMLLHEDETRFGRRFKDYTALTKKLFGKRPSWRTATALPALVYPEEYVCVRRSAFKRQAASTVPVARYTRKPRRAAYKNYQRVGRVVRTRLEAAGHEPRDLLDVHDFIWATLRNAALKHLSDDE